MRLLKGLARVVVAYQGTAAIIAADAVRSPGKTTVAVVNRHVVIKALALSVWRVERRATDVGPLWCLVSAAARGVDCIHAIERIRARLLAAAFLNRVVRVAITLVLAMDIE
jgi:hypothetical protein